MSSFWHRLIDGFKSRTSTELGELPAACCRTAWARDTLNGTSGCTWKFRVCHTGLSFGWYEAAVHNILSIPLDSTVMKPWVPGLVGERGDPVTQLLYCSVINAAWSMLGCNLCAWWCQRRVPSWKAEGKFTSGEGTEREGTWCIREAELLGHTWSMWGWDFSSVGEGPLGAQEGVCHLRDLRKPPVAVGRVTYQGDSGSRGDGPVHL